MKRFSPSKGDGRLPPLKAPRQNPPPHRPRSNEFNPPDICDANGAQSRVIKLFCKQVIDRNTHVMCGMDDKGNGAHFTPFREIAEDRTSEDVREFCEITGCLTTYLNLTEDHESDRSMCGPEQ